MDACFSLKNSPPSLVWYGLWNSFSRPTITPNAVFIKIRWWLQSLIRKHWHPNQHCLVSETAWTVIRSLNWTWFSQRWETLSIPSKNQNTCCLIWTPRCWTHTVCRKGKALTTTTRVMDTIHCSVMMDWPAICWKQNSVTVRSIAVRMRINSWYRRCRNIGQCKPPAGTCFCLQPVQLVPAPGIIRKHENTADRHYSFEAAEGRCESGTFSKVYYIQTVQQLSV